METSRDDFVIAIRSAFLKKGTQQRFSLLGLIFFSIAILVLSVFNLKPINYIKITVKEIVYRSSFIVSAPEKFIKNSYFNIQSHFNLYEKNQKIETELEDLRSKKLLNNFILEENKRLKNILDDYLVESDEIFAKVLSDKDSPFLRSIAINKGSKHNIKLGMVVLDGEYLIGKIIEVNYLSSRVLMLSDLNSKIPVIIEPSGFLSILSGTGENNGIIQYTRRDSTIENKTIVYTSGSAGLFKSGIPIGKIDDFDDNEKKVEFFSDFSQLRFVKVLLFKSEEGK
tara:strand:+ start:571 stop:1419 length:849 start_codon:yes stop_codon:yes gene_type:complete